MEDTSTGNIEKQFSKAKGELQEEVERENDLWILENLVDEYPEEAYDFLVSKHPEVLQQKDI